MIYRLYYQIKMIKTAKYSRIIENLIQQRLHINLSDRAKLANLDKFSHK